MLLTLLSLRTMLAGCLLMVAALSTANAGLKQAYTRSVSYSSMGKTTPIGDRIVGRWYFPKRESNIEIYRGENGHYYGKILAVSDATTAKFGTMSNKLLFTDLSYNRNEWAGGQLIHPQTGNRFDVFLTLSDENTLVVTAYKGCRLFSKTYTLTRI